MLRFRGVSWILCFVSYAARRKCEPNSSRCYQTAARKHDPVHRKCFFQHKDDLQQLDSWRLTPRQIVRPAIQSEGRRYFYPRCRICHARNIRLASPHHSPDIRTATDLLCLSAINFSASPSALPLVCPDRRPVLRTWVVSCESQYLPLSPYGSDSNTGKSTSAPWVSPNHSLNCGDVIIAAAGTNYSASASCTADGEL